MRDLTSALESAEQMPSLPRLPDFSAGEPTPPLLGISLTSPRQVMEAFLAGAKLQHANYADDTGEMFLYLDPDSGHFCEEDGAGAKTHRLPISFREGDPGWRVIGWYASNTRRPSLAAPIGERR